MVRGLYMAGMSRLSSRVFVESAIAVSIFITLLTMRRASFFEYPALIICFSISFL